MKKYMIILLLLWSGLGMAGEKLVPRIEVSGLEKYKNQNVELFYVSGRPAGFGTVGHVLHTHKVWAHSKELRIDGQGVVEFPSSKVVNTHGVAFNYLLFVVYSKNQSKLRLINTNGTCPAMPEVYGFKSREEYCKEGVSSEYGYLEQSYRSVRLLKPDTDGIVRLKLIVLSDVTKMPLLIGTRWD